MYPQPPLGWHGFEFVNEEKPRKLPQVHCHPLSTMRVRIELLTQMTLNYLASQDMIVKLIIIFMQGL